METMILRGMLFSSVYAAVQLCASRKPYGSLRPNSSPRAFQAINGARGVQFRESIRAPESSTNHFPEWI
jgi:hypothetical protein